MRFIASPSSSREAPLSELSKQAAYLSFADFIRFFLKTLIGIALARLLSPQDLGSYRQLFLIFSTLSGVLLLGFPQSLQFFLPKTESEAERKRFITRTMNIASALGLICAAIIYLGRHPIARTFNNPDLANLLPLFSIYPIFIFLTQIYGSIMLGLKRPLQNAQFMIFGVVADLLIILGIALFTPNLHYIVWGLIASAFVQWLYVMLCLKGLHNVWSLENFRGFKAQLNYTIPLGLSLLVGMLSVQLDKLMISGFFLPEEFAVFSLGAMELPLIGILINSVNSILLPNIANLSPSEQSEIYSASVRKNAILIFPLMVVFFLFAGEFYHFIYGERYIAAAQYFKIYLLILPLRVATYGIIFQATGKTRLVMMDAVIMLLLNAVLNYLLIRQMGMQGAAWATVAVSWLILIVYLLQIKYALGFKLLRLFPLGRLLRNLLAALLPIPLVLWFAAYIEQYILRMFAGGAFYVFLYFALAWLLRVILPLDLEFALSLLPKRK